MLLSALPLGFAVGCGIVWGGVRVLSPLAAKLLNSIILTEEVPLKLKITPFAVLLTVGFSVMTVLISSMLPAHRISKIGAIESIRGNSEQNRVKTKKQSPLNKISSRLNAEGMLSVSFASNQKKKTRGIVRALAVFLVVLTVTAYGALAVSQMILYKLGDLNSIEFSAMHDREYSLGQITSSSANDIVKELSQTEGITDLQVFYMGILIGRTDQSTYSSEYWDSMYELISLYYPEGLSTEDFEKDYKYLTPCFINVISVDSATFQGMLKEVGGNTDTSLENPCIVFNTGELSTDSVFITDRNADYQFFQVNNMTDLKTGDTLPINITGMNDKDEIEDKNINLTVAGFGTNENLDKWFTIHDENLWVITEEKIAFEINDICSNDLESGMSFSAFFNADETIPEVKSKLKLLEKMDSESIFFTRTDSISTAQMKDIIREMIRILMISFMIFSSLICFLNIYNSISGLMVSRRPDFAILRSIGMTLKQILKMCRYEMYLIILRSLVIAVPVSFILCSLFRIFIVGRFGTFNMQFPILIIVFVAFVAVASALGITAKCCIRENKSDLMNEIKKESI